MERVLFLGFSCAAGVAQLASVEALLQEPIAQCCSPWRFELAALTCAGGVQGYERSVVRTGALGWALSVAKRVAYSGLSLRPARLEQGRQGFCKHFVSLCVFPSARVPYPVNLQLCGCQTCG